MGRIISNPSLARWISLSLSSTSNGYGGVMARRSKIVERDEERLPLLLRISSFSLLDGMAAVVLCFRIWSLHGSCPFWQDEGGDNYTAGTIWLEKYSYHIVARQSFCTPPLIASKKRIACFHRNIVFLLLKPSVDVQNLKHTLKTKFCSLPKY